MDKYELIQKIEEFAPPDTQEDWDCSGWLVESKKIDVNKVCGYYLDNWFFIDLVNKRCMHI